MIEKVISRLISDENDEAAVQHVISRTNHSAPLQWHHAADWTDLMDQRTDNGSLRGTKNTRHAAVTHTKSTAATFTSSREVNSLLAAAGAQHKHVCLHFIHTMILTHFLLIQNNLKIMVKIKSMKLFLMNHSGMTVVLKDFPQSKESFQSFFYLTGKTCQISTYLILLRNTFSLQFPPRLMCSDNRLRLNFRLNTEQPVIQTISKSAFFLSFFLSFFPSFFLSTCSEPK